MIMELPWNALYLDNKRMRPVRLQSGHSRMATTREYKHAKMVAQGLLRTQYRGRPMIGPVALHVDVWVPDNMVRDVTNYAKMLGDALVGIVLVDDRWQVLRRTTWEVPGVDRENPRAVLTIEPWGEP